MYFYTYYSIWFFTKAKILTDAAQNHLGNFLTSWKEFYFFIIIIEIKWIYLIDCIWVSNTPSPLRQEYFEKVLTIDSDVYTFKLKLYS